MSRQQLVEAVRTATAETPYVVHETPEGFDLTIDVVDARWWTVLRQNRLDKVFTHEVRLDETHRRYTLTDVSRTLSWSAGAGAGPTLGGKATLQRGRVHEASYGKQLGVDARSGHVGVVASWSFTSGEGRDIIRHAARAAGWKERMSGEQRGALVVACIGGLGAVATLVALGLRALLG